MVQANTKIVRLSNKAEKLYDELVKEAKLIPSETPQKSEWRETMRHVEKRYEDI
jgi:polyhydroxyalkanoate synthesis regulator phasin